MGQGIVLTRGVAVKDLAVGSLMLEILPIDDLPNTDGDVGKNTMENTTTLDKDGSAASVAIDTTKAVTAKWLPIMNPNQVTPPLLVKGEYVGLLNIDGTDEYYWYPWTNSFDLRLHDVFRLYFPSKPGISKDNLDQKGYMLVVDTLNKFAAFKTTNADGEVTTYDIELDTKKGYFSFEDGFGNKFQLNSVTGESFTNVKKKTTINTPKLAINSNSAELISTLSELTSVLMSQIHIDSRNGNTSVSPGTKNKLQAIKTKIDSFIG